MTASHVSHKFFSFVIALSFPRHTDGRDRQTDQTGKEGRGVVGTYVMLQLMRTLAKRLKCSATLPPHTHTHSHVWQYWLSFFPLVSFTLLTSLFLFYLPPHSLANDLGAESTCWRASWHRCYHRLPHGGASQVSLTFPVLNFMQHCFLFLLHFSLLFSFWLLIEKYFAHSFDLIWFWFSFLSLSLEPSSIGCTIL